MTSINQQNSPSSKRIPDPNSVLVLQPGESSLVVPATTVPHALWDASSQNVKTSDSMMPEQCDPDCVDSRSILAPVNTASGAVHTTSSDDHIQQAIKSSEVTGVFHNFSDDTRFSGTPSQTDSVALGTTSINTRETSAQRLQDLTGMGYKLSDDLTTSTSSSAKILAQYQITDNAYISMQMINGQIQSYMKSANPFNSKEYELKIDVKFPSGMNANKPPQVPTRQLEELFSNFGIKRSSNAYNLVPLLRGGGGTCCRKACDVSMSQDLSSLSPQILLERQTGPAIQAAGAQKFDRIVNFLLKRDNYRQLDPNDTKIQIGGIYKNIADQIMELVQNEPSQRKLFLSEQQFDMYLSVKLPEIEQKILNKKLKLIEQYRGQTGHLEGHAKQGNLAQLLSELVNFTQPLYKVPTRKYTTALVNMQIAKMARQNETKQTQSYLHNYQTRILERWILQTLIQSIHPGDDVIKSEFYHRIANQLAMTCQMSTNSQVESISEAIHANLDILSLSELSEETEEQKERVPGRIDTLERLFAFQKVKEFIDRQGDGAWADPSLVLLNWDQALKLLEKYQLREIPWREYTTLLLVKHYNLITDNGNDQNIENPVDARNKRKIEEIVIKCILVYQEKEDAITSDEFGEIINLGSLKHRPDVQPEMFFTNFEKQSTKEIEAHTTHQVSLFHRILGRLVADIKNDELFSPEKIQGLAQLIAQVGTEVVVDNSEEINSPITSNRSPRGGRDSPTPTNTQHSVQHTQNTPVNTQHTPRHTQNTPLATQLSVQAKGVICTPDDLKSWLDALRCQLDRLLFTAENSNTQLCLDSMNLLLNIMGLMKVKGYRESDYEILSQSLQKAFPSIAKKIFSISTKAVDPSLQYKAEYALEALKQIEPDDNALTPEEKIAVGLGPAILSMIVGAYGGYTDAFFDSLRDIGSSVWDFWNEQTKSWFDEVNQMKSLSQTNFKRFEKAYFEPKTGIFASQKRPSPNLLFFTANQLDLIARNRHRTYEDRRSSILHLGHLYLYCWKWDRDIRYWIRCSLTALSKKPLESIAFYELSLQEIAASVMHKLNLQAEPIDKDFVYTEPSITSGNSLLQEAMEKHLSLDWVLSQLQQNNAKEFEEFIKPLHLIMIEGNSFKKGEIKSKVPINLQKVGLPKFLKSQEEVWLIQGDAGTGKSIFLRLIEKQLWKMYNQGTSQYIPIFVRLSDVKNPERCIEELLMNMYFSKRTVQLMHDRQGPFLFIFDGYDELKAPKNLYKSNNLKAFGHRTKMIITSREEYLKSYGNYQKYFKPKHSSSVFEHRIADITKEQRDEYIGKVVKQNSERFLLLDNTADSHEKKQLRHWTYTSSFINGINKITGLLDLMKTPYMLKIIVDILPQLDTSTRQGITRAALYKTFTRNHFEVESNRLMENNAHDIPKGYDLETSFYNFSKDLAIRMWLLEKTSVDTESGNFVTNDNELYQIMEKREPSSPKSGDTFSKFFALDKKTTLARQGAQLIVLDNQARFSHKSIMEYFAARNIYEKIKNYQHQDPTDFLALKLLLGQKETNQESDVLNFVVDMVTDNHNQQRSLQGENPDETGVHVIEYLRHKAKDLLSKPSSSDNEVQNFWAISCHFAEALELQQQENQKLLELAFKEGQHPYVHLKMIQQIVQVLFEKSKPSRNSIEVDENKKKEDEENRNIYELCAEYAVNYELQGDYDGPYEKDKKTGVWKAHTGPYEKNPHKAVVPGSRITLISATEFSSTEQSYEIHPITDNRIEIKKLVNRIIVSANWEVQGHGNKTARIFVVLKKGREVVATHDCFNVIPGQRINSWAMLTKDSENCVDLFGMMEIGMFLEAQVAAEGHSLKIHSFTMMVQDEKASDLEDIEHWFGDQQPLKDSMLSVKEENTTEMNHIPGTETGSIVFNSQSNMEECKGEWMNNKFSGYGTAKFKIQEPYDTYEGNWDNGKFHLRGTLIYKSGLKFEGEFDHGLRHGEGTYYFTEEPQKSANYAKKYTGTWSKDICQSGNIFFEKPSQFGSQIGSQTCLRGELLANGTFKIDTQHIARRYTKSSNQGSEMLLHKLVPSLTQFAKEKILDCDLSRLQITPTLQAYLVGLFGGVGKKLSFAPWSTNDGQDSRRYRLTNIAVKGRGYYCSKGFNHRNIVIKSHYVPSKSEPNFEFFLEKWDGEHKGPQEDKNLFTALQLACQDDASVVTGMRIETAGYGFSSPMTAAVIFLGETPDFETITNFYDTVDLASIQMATESNGYAMDYFDTEHYEYTVFHKQSSSMQPAVWIRFKQSAWDNDQRLARIVFGNQLFIAKHMIMILHSVTPRGNSENVDMSYVIPEGFELA